MKPSQLCAIVAFAVFTSAAHAADPPAQGPAPNPNGPGGAPGNGERLNVDSIKRNYWNRSDDGSPRVVQNRLYSKAKKLELGVYLGLVSTDPFLDVKNLGVSMGFHFTEEWGLNLLLWKFFSSNSAAEQYLEESLQATANSNYLYSYKGAEVLFSPIYGKLALLNEVIIHYDFHLLAGGGIVGTESGNDLAFSFGLGQQVYIGKNISLRLDYRNLRYSEKLLGKDRASPASFGKVVKERTNSTDVITLGVNFLFGFSSEK